MDLKENFAEGFRAIKGNMLRAVLTATIIAFGILALVGILTAVDGIQNNVNQSLSGLGANTFDIITESRQGRRGGVRDKPIPPIFYREALDYKTLFESNLDARVSIFTGVTGSAEVKFESKKTNPNIRVIGVDEEFLEMKAYSLQSGRNVTTSDMQLSSKVAVVGLELVKKLFPKESPLDKDISFLGNHFRIIGVLNEKGSLSGGGDDRVILIPLTSGRQFDTGGNFSYEITNSVENVKDIEEAIGEATAAMRRVRRDATTDEDSFRIERADSLVKQTEQITSGMQIGGLVISIITLLGAAIALMNIMMVSVTERTREIGVRKALGATPSKIRMQFLLEAIIICLFGGIAGVILGIAGGNLVSSLMFDDSQFIIPWGWMIIGLVVCVSVGILSGFYPAYKASKLDPIESLRYE